jgi:hypothetical protein
MDEKNPHKGGRKMKPLDADDKVVSGSAADQSPGTRLGKLSELFPIHKLLAPPTSTSGLVIAILLVVMVIAAVVLGAAASGVVESYISHLRDLIF